ncbi:MAG: HEAT repeat domain-containing protein [Planctomycetota bacterium]
MQDSFIAPGMLLLAALAGGCAGGAEARPEPRGMTAARLRVLEPALHHPEPAMRRKTVSAVGAQGASAGNLLLAGLAEERDAGVRQQYARELRNVPGPDVRAALAELAADARETEGVRLTAVQSLAAHGASAELVELAGGADGTARAARLALMVAGGEPAQAFFRAAAVRPAGGAALRREMVHGFCRVAVPADLDLLRAFIQDDDPMIRRSAARALGRLGDPADRPLLARLAGRDPDRSVRRAARVALYRCGSVR